MLEGTRETKLLSIEITLDKSPDLVFKLYVDPTTREYQGKRVNPHIGPLAKVIRLKLFLDIVPSSFADITRALRGFSHGGSVYALFRFKAK